jgi:predicted site-specific integrase-resolvase
MVTQSTKGRATCNIADVAVRYQVSISTVREWIHSGRIPVDAYFRAGGGNVDKLGRVRGRLVFYVDSLDQLERSWR